MTIAENLNDLESKLVNVKNTMVNNLTEKGVSSVTTASTLSEMAHSITTIPTGGGTGGDINAQWKEIGYASQPDCLTDGLAYAKEILEAKKQGGNEWKKKLDSPRCTILPNFNGYALERGEFPEYCKYVDEIDLPSISIMYFYGLNLSYIQKINAPSTDSFNSTFEDCNINYIGDMFIPKVTDLRRCFYGCVYLLSTPIINLTNVQKVDNLFYNCGKLGLIRFLGNPANIGQFTDMFGSSSSTGLAKNGTLIYDQKYDYSKIIEELHKFNPTWKVMSDFEPQECTSLSITADNCEGNVTQTMIHYTAIANGVSTLSGERITGVTITGDAISEDFGENPSKDTSREVTINYTYLGQTATTTITQQKNVVTAAYTVDLNNQWCLSTTKTNPSPTEYEGVYESIKSGNEGKQSIAINFNGIQNFEFYVASYDNYKMGQYTVMYVGEMDDADPTFDTCLMNSNDMANITDNNISSYTKVSIPNDGKKHFIKIVYEKSVFGGETDQGYLLIKRAQS